MDSTGAPGADVMIGTQWEYLLLTFRRAQLRAEMEKLNQAGALGWEAVWTSQGDDTSDVVVLLKRPQVSKLVNPDRQD